jgi:spermidine synthase
LAAFVSGLVSIATQVAWSRVLALIVGSTTYAFTSVLLVYLVALGAGSALAVRVSRRRDRAGVALAVAFGATALLGILAVVFVHRLPSWYLGLFAIIGPEVSNGLVLRGVVSAFLVMFPPVFAAGTILPLTLAAALPPEARETGHAVGRIYAVNTLGSISGAILGGFILIPGIGTQRTLLGMALVCLATGLVFAFNLERPAWLRPVAVGTAVVTLLGVLLVPRWDHMRLHAGVFEVARHFGGTERLRERLDMASPDALGQALYQREGRTASVVVMQTGPIRGMKIDARANASNDSSDMATQIMLAMYPLLLAPKAEDVFVVGWGSGVTVGAALQTPLKSLTAVELEPAVVEASQFYNDLNHEPLSDARVHLFEDDARHILLASNDTYDVIISEPPHPWVSGVANLFTQDFYQLAARRLRPEGVFAQWVQSYQISFETYRSILAGFNSVFPYTYVLYVLGSVDTILIGSHQPLRFDPEELARRFAEPERAAELERVGMLKPEYVLAGASIGPEQVREVVHKATINTDDNMLVEFQATGGVADANGGETVLWELERRATPIDKLVADPDGLLDDRQRTLAYVEGLRAMERDASSWEKALGIEPAAAAVEGEAAGGGAPDGSASGAPADGAPAGGVPADGAATGGAEAAPAAAFRYPCPRDCSRRAPAPVARSAVKHPAERRERRSESRPPHPCDSGRSPPRARRAGRCWRSREFAATRRTPGRPGDARPGSRGGRPPALPRE